MTNNPLDPNQEDKKEVHIEGRDENNDRPLESDKITHIDLPKTGPDIKATGEVQYFGNSKDDGLLRNPLQAPEDEYFDHKMDPNALSSNVRLGLGPDALAGMKYVFGGKGKPPLYVLALPLNGEILKQNQNYAVRDYVAGLLPQQREKIEQRAKEARRDREREMTNDPTNISSSDNQEAQKKTLPTKIVNLFGANGLLSKCNNPERLESAMRLGSEAMIAMVLSQGFNRCSKDGVPTKEPRPSGSKNNEQKNAP